MQSIKIVVVGDGAVGKTSFLISFTMNAFPNEYVPTVFDNFNCMYEFEGSNISLGLWDTAGQQDFEKLRPISYKESDIYLLFFSVMNPTSLENIKLRWVDEIRTHSPNTPYYLIGTQIDERDNDELINSLKERGKHPVSAKEGKESAKEIGAIGYLEIAPKQMNFGSIFDDVIRYVVNIRRAGKKKGKFCWSIHCRDKISNFNQAKCKDCQNLMCLDCIEIWENGYKGCPHCSIKRKKSEKDFKIRKPRKSPEEKLKEQEEKFRRKMQKHLNKHKNINEEDIEKYLNKENMSSDDTEQDGV
jgi:small GTP-binding protein